MNAHTINRYTIVSTNGSTNASTNAHTIDQLNVYTIAYAIVSINVSTINRPYERLHACM